MVKRIKNLVYFDLNSAFKNKIVVIYTLIFPIIFLLLNRNNFLNNHNLIYGFWAYIVVIGVLNGIVAGTINMRESNFFKMFSYIAKSKELVFFANLIAQVIFLEMELFIFNLFVIVIGGGFIWQKILYCFLISLVIIPLCAINLSFFLVIKMKNNTYNALLNAYMFVIMFTAFLNINDFISWLIILVNPIAYITRVYVLFNSNNFQLLDLVILIGLGVVYLLIGIFSIKKMPISGITSRY